MRRQKQFAPQSDDIALRALEAGLEFILKELGPRVPVRLAQTLMAVGAQCSATRKEIITAVDAPEVTIIRDLDLLGSHGHGTKPGLGLVEERWDPVEPRRLIYMISPKGRAVLDALNAAVLLQTPQT